MKKSILILIVVSLFTYSNVEAQQWKMVISKKRVTGERIAVYIDLTSITRENGLVYVIQKETYEPPLRGIDSEMISLVAYDCEKMLFALPYHAFLDQNGKITSGEDKRSQKLEFQSYEREGLFRLAPMRESCLLDELPPEKRR